MLKTGVRCHKMLRHAMTYARVTAYITRQVRGAHDIDGSPTILQVSANRVIVKSLIGQCAYRSLKFDDVAKVATVTWVSFSGNTGPWLVVLLDSCSLVLFAPDGSQVEAALPFHVDCIWPILPCPVSKGGGLFFSACNPSFVHLIYRHEFPYSQ